MALLLTVRPSSAHPGGARYPTTLELQSSSIFPRASIAEIRVHTVDLPIHHPALLYALLTRDQFSQYQ